MLDANISFRRALEARLIQPLQTAVKLSRFHSTMPQWKKDEFRSRLLGDHEPDDVLLELDTAAHYFTLGYEIDWIPPGAAEGRRTAEFVAHAGDIQFEVECKAKEADSGRKIERAAFYRLADLVVPILNDRSLCGTISITVPKRLPTDDRWRSLVLSSLRDNVAPSQSTLTIEGQAQLDINLVPAADKPQSFQTIIDSMDPASHPYAHHLVVGKRDGNLILNPIILRVESATRDEFLQNVLTSLRSANDQFSGESSGVICCRIPEIDSFEGLERDSALKNMTAVFFGRHARDLVYAVTYVSEARRQEQGQYILTDMPALVFRSNTYTGPLSDEVPLIA